MKQPHLTAAGYHRATGYRRHQMAPHMLDWAHQPQLIKPYVERPQVALKRRLNLPNIDYSTLFQHDHTDKDVRAERLTFQRLSTIIELTHAITARSRSAGQAFYFRSVASAGALYPFELYLAAHRVNGFASGVYHHHLFGNALTQLRRRQVAVFPPVDRGVSATFYITGIFFRSAWKYRSRAYRYVLLDGGHLLENLRLALRALNLAFSVHLDFDDTDAATLLGLNPDLEACLICVHLYDGGASQAPDLVQGAAPLGTDIIQASTVSARAVAYTDILDIHKAGGAAGDRAVASPTKPTVLNTPPLSWIDLKTSTRLAAADYKDVLWQRRSHRNFIAQSVSTKPFMAFADAMARAMLASGGMPGVCRSALTTGFLVGDDMPVPSGFYILDAQRQRLGRVCEGQLMAPMAAACLDQMWLKHAGLHVLFIADIGSLDRAWGARGYRYAMIEAGRLGQQAYLSATALGWGACGIGAIYDWEAAELLNLAPDAVLLYLVAVGPVKKL